MKYFYYSDVVLLPLLTDCSTKRLILVAKSAFTNLTVTTLVSPTMSKAIFFYEQFPIMITVLEVTQNGTRKKYPLFK